MGSQPQYVEDILRENLWLRKRVADLEANWDQQALRQAEVALLQSEKKYQQLVKYAPAGIYEIDFRNMTLTSVNDVLCQISGYSCEEMININPYDLFDGPSQQMLRSRAQLWLRGEEPDNSVDYVMKTKDGRSCHVNLQVKYTVNEEKQPLGAIGIIHDITERKEAEKIITHQNTLLNGINRIFNEALDCRSEEELGNTCLKVVQDLTQSQFGFIDLVSEDGYIEVVAISDPGWEDCLINEPRYTPPNGSKICGIRGRVVKDGKSIFTNDLTNHSDFIGFPPGHPMVNTFLGTPLRQGDEIIGMVGLGNKQNGYDQRDIETIESLSHAIVQALMSKKSEIALRESEERYRQLFEAMNEGFALSEVVRNEMGEIIDHRVLEANQATERHTGINPNQVVGRLWNQATHVHDNLMLEMCARVVNLGEPLQIEQHYDPILKRWLSIGLFPCGGDKFGMILKDISKRVLLNNELEASEKLYRTIFNNSEDGFVLAEIVYDEQGTPEDFVIHNVNSAFEAQTGLEGNNIIGRKSKDIAIKVKPEWYEIADRVVKTGSPLHIESYNKRRERWYDIHLFKYSDTMFGELFRDITARKKAETEIARLDRLNLIGEMAASIGHEIRNPMTSVRGFLQMLGFKEEYRDDQEIFELMIEELDRANEIITEYLNMARDKRIERKAKSIDKVVKALCPMIRSDANLREINVKLDLNNPPKPKIDEKEIRQLIMNMARNSLEAMTNKGTLTIGTGLADGSIILYVKDEGHGLAAEVQEKMGTPFVTTKDSGTGLGLAVCYSIAARHNAKIEFDTGPSGTTFYIRFPLPSGS